MNRPGSAGPGVKEKIKQKMRKSHHDISPSPGISFQSVLDFYGSTLVGDVTGMLQAGQQGSHKRHTETTANNL